MVRKCVVYGCSASNADGVSLHEWPKDERIGRLWTRFVKTKRAHWTNKSKSTVICSKHFTEDCFENLVQRSLGFGSKRPKLLPCACPTIHSCLSPDKENCNTNPRRPVYEKRERSRISVAKGTKPELGSAAEPGHASTSTEPPQKVPKLRRAFVKRRIVEMLQEASSAQAVDINPTDLVHSKSCETEKVAGKKQWKQKQSKRLSQAKKEKLDRAQDQRSLNLGAAFQRWRDFRQERGFNTDAELATFLLDFVCTKDTHTGNQDNLKNPKVNKLKEECQHLDNNDPKLTLVKWLVPVLKKESWVKSSGRGPGEHGEKGTKDDSVDAPLEDEVLDSRGRFKEEDAEPEAEWQPYEDQPVSYSGYNVPDLSDNADLSEMATVNKMTIKLEPDEEQHVDVKKEMKEELKIENPLLPVFDAGWKTCETDPKHGQDGGRPAVQVKMESERSDLKRAREENGGHNEDEQTQKKRSIPLDRDGHHGGGLRCQDAGQDRDFPRGCKEDELNQTLTSLLTQVAHLTFLTDKLSAHVREMCRKQVSFSLHSKK